MEEKRKDLVSTKQKEVVMLILAKLQAEHPDFYYLSTTDIAHEIVSYAKEPGRISREDLALITSLSARDVQMILSLHN